MIGRIAWFAALLAIAVVTTGVELDRESGRKPALAPLVPEPFRAFAQPRIVGEATRSTDAAQALAEARRLIRRRPLPAEHLSLLAVAQTKAQMPQAAAITIQVAGQRGWREPIAQEAVLRLALAAGDRPEAARRYLALLLESAASDALLRELGPPIFEGAEGEPGRAAMAEVVADTERWPDLFLRRGERVMPAKVFAEVVATAAARGADFDCAVLEKTQAAVARKDDEAARILEPAVRSCRAG
ncbi:MAG: hypothetical protein GC147_04355 [Porphyrobacter sp.]|nr:hypothetical protein [Porphyrobacter sp.]